MLTILWHNRTVKLRGNVWMTVHLKMGGRVGSTFQTFMHKWIKVQIWIPYDWGGSRDSVFLTNPQVMLMLLVCQPYFEQESSSICRDMIMCYLFCLFWAYWVHFMLNPKSNKSVLWDKGINEQLYQQLSRGCCYNFVMITIPMTIVIATNMVLSHTLFNLAFSSKPWDR